MISVSLWRNTPEKTMDINKELRIAKMEMYLDDSCVAIEALSDALREYEEIQDKYFELVKYYSSQEWMADFEADEAGLIPAELKRGVLSEDAVYDLITDHHDLMTRMLTAAQRGLEDLEEKQGETGDRE